MSLKGYKQTKEHKRKIEESQKGQHHSSKTEFKKGHSFIKGGEKGWFKKGKIPKGSKLFKKGQKSWNKGLKGYHAGEKCNFWKGGLSYEPYSPDWTETLRRSIRERDGYVCKLCSKLQGDISHDVHHIDYNKKNCSPENLITLCRICNSKVNRNRNYWTKYFYATTRR